jgi:myo-inositol catabolism protein IolS
MLYREIKSFAKPVSLISFGGAALSGEGGGYGFGEMNEEAAEDLIKTGLEHGVTLFDTAPIYGFGLSEERLGRYLPKDAVVISKGGVDWHSSRRVNMTNEPKVIERMLHESLKRLKREQIDIYMIHWPDPRVDIRYPMEVLQRAQSAGKIHKIGLCNTNAHDLSLAEEIATIEVVQSELNLFNTQAFDQLGELQERLSMAWGTLDKGILSGRVTPQRQFAASDARSWAPWWKKSEVLQKIERVAKLKQLLDERELDLVQFCLQFNLNYYGVSTTLVGYKTKEDLVKLTSHLQRNIPREKMQEVLNLWDK